MKGGYPYESSWGEKRRVLLWRALIKSCANCGARIGHRDDCIIVYAYDKNLADRRAGVET